MGLERENRVSMVVKMILRFTFIFIFLSLSSFFVRKVLVNITIFACGRHQGIHKGVIRPIKGNTREISNNIFKFLYSYEFAGRGVSTGLECGNRISVIV